MLAAIDFHHQPGFGTIKIYDVSLDGFLPEETDGIVLQKLEPQMAFFCCHIFAKPSSQWFEALIMGGCCWCKVKGLDCW